MTTAFNDFHYYYYYFPDYIHMSKFVKDVKHINSSATHFYGEITRGNLKVLISQHVINIDMNTVFLSSTITFVTYAGKMSRNEQINNN